MLYTYLRLLAHLLTCTFKVRWLVISFPNFCHKKLIVFSESLFTDKNSALFIFQCSAAASKTAYLYYHIPPLLSSTFLKLFLFFFKFLEASLKSDSLFIISCFFDFVNRFFDFFSKLCKMHCYLSFRVTVFIHYCQLSPFKKDFLSHQATHYPMHRLAFSSPLLETMQHFPP